MENQSNEHGDELIIPKFTRDQFMNDEAFKWLYSFQDQPEKFTKMNIWLEKYVTGSLKFKSIEYNTLKNLYLQKNGHVGDEENEEKKNMTVFSNQPLQLVCGKYSTGQSGVSYLSDKGITIEVISHPIMPVKRYVNIDEETEQIELWFQRGRNGWRTIVVPKKTMSSAQEIVELSNHGISVTTENAKELVKYLSFLENANFEKLPVKYSTSRLGWVKGKFIPYDSDLVFDTSSGNYAEMFSAVHEHGDFEAWKEIIKTRRTKDSINLPFRLMMAASFASPLIEPLQSLTFWLHCTGDSGSGKTINLMCAASIWGDPIVGRYTQTFDTTKAALEYLAGFTNSLPVCLDERQTVEDSKKTNLSEYVYGFCNTSGKNRAIKQGGLRKKNNWHNVAISTGEQEITNFSSKAGNQLRVIDVSFEPGEKMFLSVSEANSFVRVIEDNYGHAGKEYIRNFQQEDLAQISKRLNDLRCELEKTVTGRQINFGALLILADELAEKYIFHDGIILTVDELAQFLKTDEDVDMNVHTYQLLVDWLVSNKAKFITQEDAAYIPNPLYGKATGNTYFILKSKLEEFFQQYNLSSRLFRRWAMQKGVIVSHATEKDKYHHEATFFVDGQEYKAWEIKINALNKPGNISVPNGMTQVDFSDDDLPF